MTIPEKIRLDCNIPSPALPHRLPTLVADYISVFKGVDLG